MSIKDKYRNNPRQQQVDIDNILVDGIKKPFKILDLIDNKEFGVPNPRTLFEIEEREKENRIRAEQEEINRRIEESERLRIQAEEEADRLKKQEAENAEKKRLEDEEKDRIRAEEQRRSAIIRAEEERKKSIDDFWGGVGAIVILLGIIGVGLLISSLSGK